MQSLYTATSDLDYSDENQPYETCRHGEKYPAGEDPRQHCEFCDTYGPERPETAQEGWLRVNGNADRGEN